MPRLSSHFGLQDPRFQSVLMPHDRSTVLISTAGNLSTLTPAQVLSGWINRDGNGGARTDTLPSAAAMVEAVQGACHGEHVLGARILRNLDGIRGSHHARTGGRRRDRPSGPLTMAQSNATRTYHVRRSPT